MNAENKLIVIAAVCGASTSRAQTPYVPITPEEIAAEVIACARAGAAVAHIHVRDENGNNTLDIEKFRRVLAIVRESGTDIVINLTTACDNVSHEHRLRHLVEIKPEMGSVDIGSLNWAYDHVFLNEPEFLEKITVCMRDHQIKPELEIFDAGMINNAKYYMKKGMIVGNPHFQFVLGVPGALDATVENLLFLVNKLPENATWSALGIGKNAMAIMLAALSLGAPAVRVGLEDGVYYSKGILAKSNAQLVERAVRIARESGREIATPDEARMILGLINSPLA
ncbi:MAG: 3-keto-5-aminohexanoate cleavage protein [Clostridiales bacterium]|nr:3-keto-5-aminohexanoate cleavage protein [Clostridiales bacterium]